MFLAVAVAAVVVVVVVMPPPFRGCERNPSSLCGREAAIRTGRTDKQEESSVQDKRADINITRSSGSFVQDSARGWKGSVHAIRRGRRLAADP